MRKVIFILLLLTVFMVPREVITQDKLLQISAKITPYRIKQGNQGILKLKIDPIATIRIASQPEFQIRLLENKDIIYSKFFFNSSELDFKTIKEENTIFLRFEDKEIPISFTLKENALPGNRRIHGEIIFTAVFKDNWSLKTYQKFTAYYKAMPNNQLRRTY